MEDFRILLVPKERPGSLYWNHYCDFRIGVAMCFEKRFGAEYEEASSENVLTSVAIETSRSFFRGRRQWPQASQSADPQVRRAGRRWETEPGKLWLGRLGKGFWGLGAAGPQGSQ